MGSHASAEEGSQSSKASSAHTLSEKDPTPPVSDHEPPLESDHEHGMPPLKLSLVFGGRTFTRAVTFEHPSVKVDCTNDGHVGCSRIRGLGPAQTSKHGEWETIVFFAGVEPLWA